MVIIQIIAIIMVQLNVLFWCIRKALMADEFSKKQRAIWIGVMVLIPVFGAITFLLITRKKNHNVVLKDVGNGFDENLKTSIFLGLFYIFEFISLVFVYLNPNNIWIISLLIFASVLLIVLHTYGDKLGKWVLNILPYIMILAVVIAQYLSVNEDYGFVILVAEAIIIIDYPLKYSRHYFWIPLLMFLSGSIIKIYVVQSGMPTNYLVDFVIMNTITYTIVIGAFYYIKRQLVMNNYLQYLMLELKNKTQELEEASVLKERNRIAREIHDTLGHTLTGAIIQLEVAKKMLHDNPKKAEQSIIETQDITRQGFSEVKRAIQALRPIMIDENTLEEGLELLFERMEKDYGFCVEKDIELPDKISDNLKISVFRIVQELFTNSIRHGQADMMEIKIEYQFDTLRINTKDNGKGCEQIKEGNGLMGIRERVEKLGGQMGFSSEVGKGFGTVIYIPI